VFDQSVEVGIGSHNLTVKAYDRFDKTSEEVARTFKVVQEAPAEKPEPEPEPEPEAPVYAPADDQVAPVITDVTFSRRTNRALLPVTGTVSEAVAFVKVNGAKADVTHVDGRYAFAAEVPLTEQGEQTITVTAQDRAGNRAAEVTDTVILDSIAPVITISEPVREVMHREELDIAGWVQDLHLGGDVFIGINAPVNLRQLPVRPLGFGGKPRTRADYRTFFSGFQFGVHYMLYVTAVDSFGNRAEKRVEFEVRR
jgi:hypothetical protein